ncbi:hypothetical protein FP435_04420 [Lactobacillus sp. PV037]|uniref:hypothetical protein n=1 Tax=Lactobacillus sp. PV037 TaxID=2594496 RepID=UPI00223F4BE2|nr:hypothetical protein [Lactobacillus sp. PV037]QNQ83739.1 hypothetical protein FP435_04420 [Lactobacillus sp. PV037]
MAKEIKGDDGKTYVIKQKKPWYKRWWAWVLIALAVIIVFAIIAGSGEDDSGSSSNSSSQNQTSVSTSKKTYKNTAKAVTLGAGSFEVGAGKDIEPGRYVIKAESGDGNFQSDGGEDINIILGTTPDEDGGQVDSYTTTLVKGEKIKISGIEKTSFEPAPKPKFQTSFGPGTWIVGQDIKPGRYEIKAVRGSGNITSNNSDINEILGTTADNDEGQITHFTADLTDGEAITTDVQEIELVKK